MMCEQCGNKQATVHLTKIVNGQKKETHLCSNCAGSFSDFVPGIDFQNMLASMLDQPQVWDPVQSNAVHCPVCNFTLADIQHHSQLGCSECYNTFGREVSNLIRRIHGTTKHVGKVPKTGHERVLLTRQIEETRQKLKQAVASEEYEEAATLRDEIKELEAKLRAKTEGGTANES